MSGSDVDSPKSGGTYPINLEGEVGGSSDVGRDQATYSETWSDVSSSQTESRDAWKEWLRGKLKLEMQLCEANKRKAKFAEAERKALEREEQKKERLAMKNRLLWLEKKDLKVQEERKKNLERSKASLEEVKRVQAEEWEIEKQKTFNLWLRRKREEQKAQQLMREQEEKEKELLNLKKQKKSEAAFKAWCEKAKHRPKPMSVRISDSTDEAHKHVTANYNWNDWVDSSGGGGSKTSLCD